MFSLSANTTHQLDQIYNSLTAGTIDSATGPLPLMSRMVTFGSKWRDCRGTGSLLTSGISDTQLAVGCDIRVDLTQLPDAHIHS